MTASRVQSYLVDRIHVIAGHRLAARLVSGEKQDRLEYRLQAEKTGPTRVNAELRTAADARATTVMRPSASRD